MSLLMLRRLAIVICSLVPFVALGQDYVIGRISQFKGASETEEYLKGFGLWMPDAGNEEEMDEIARRWANVLKDTPVGAINALSEGQAQVLLRAWDLGPAPNAEFDRVNLIWEYVLPRMGYGVRDIPKDVVASMHPTKQFLNLYKDRISVIVIILTSYLILEHLVNKQAALASATVMILIASAEITAKFTNKENLWNGLTFSDSSRTKRFSQIIDVVSAQHDNALKGFSKIVKETAAQKDLRFRQPLMALVRKCLY